jgi:hypothetical protein
LSLPVLVRIAIPALAKKAGTYNQESNSLVPLKKGAKRLARRSSEELSQGFPMKYWNIGELLPMLT